jgi:hypothetical protein
MGTIGRIKVAPSMTIASGGTTSNALPSSVLEDLVAAMLYGPAAVDGATTYTLEANANPNASSSDSGWIALCDSSGTQLQPPGVNKAQLYSEIPHCGAVRIKASGTVAADRTWKLTGVETN